VDLRFTDGALTEIARQAIERKTGARALRTIIEEATLDIMYEVPSQREIEEVVITEETIRDKHAPDIRYFNRAA
jgi:ATP-dependent Clp protease ATP-binding subunit ClpX